MGSPEGAPNLLQTVLTNQNAVFLGFWAVWGPPVGRASRLKMDFPDSLLRLGGEGFDGFGQLAAQMEQPIGIGQDAATVSATRVRKAQQLG